MSTVWKNIARVVPATLVVAIAAGAILTAPAATAGEQATGEKAACYLEKLPPMIDREVFFSDPEISGTQISRVQTR